MEAIKFGSSRTATTTMLLLQDKLILCKDGILRKTSSQGNSQIVIPIALVPEVLRLVHDNAFSGHQGVKETLTQILDRFWCHTCGERMPPHQRARPPLKERSIVEKQFEINRH